MEHDDGSPVIVGDVMVGSLGIADSSAYVYTGSGWADINASTSATSVATTDDIAEVTDRLVKIEERLAILNSPDPKLLETYPALREAYDAYKLIERLVEGNNDN